MMQLDSFNKVLRENYNIDSVDEIIRTSEGLQNDNYVVRTSSSKFILKNKNKQVYDESEDRAREEKIAWIIASIGRKLPFVIGPMLNNDGDFTSLYEDNVYLLYPFIQGKHCEYDDAKVISEIGRKIALFHNGTVEYTNLCPTQEDFAFESRFESLCCSNLANDDMVKKVIEVFQKQKKPKIKSPVIIHGDLTPTNILFDGSDIVGIIDFDNIRVSEREEEIVRFAMSLDGANYEQLASAFINNYKKSSHSNLRLTNERIRYYAYKDLIEELAIWNNNILQNNKAKPIAFYMQMLSETLKKARRMDEIIDIIEVVNNQTLDRK